MSKSVVLINPPLSLEERYGKEMQKFGAVTEPLGLAYVAGYLDAHQVPVRIIDAPALDWDAQRVVEEIARGGETWVGITLLTPAFDVVKNLCRKIKNRLPGAMIVLGGAHCTALPERTLREIPSADIVCFGEGELTMLELVSSDQSPSLARIQGICFRDGRGIARNEARPYVEDLDQIPPPARHLLPMEKYHLTASRVSGGGYCPTIIVARGCPFKCTYCSRTFGKTFRPHSISRIMAEIDHLVTTYRVSQVNIEADTLTVNKRFLKGMCEALIDSGLNKRIRWTCESRVDTVDEDTLDLMRRAGCWQISYGVETGSQRLLDVINKGVTLKQVETAFALTKKAGISIRGFFMLGLPTETREESFQTIAFAKKLDPLWAQFTVTTPYPGTRMFEELDRQGKIKTYDWGKYNTWSGWKNESDIPFVADGRTVEELIDLQRLALRAFYLRPAVFLRFFSTLRSFHDLKKYITGFWVLVNSKLTAGPKQ